MVKEGRKKKEVVMVCHNMTMANIMQKVSKLKNGC